MITLIAPGEYYSSYGGAEIYIKNFAHELFRREEVSVIAIVNRPDWKQPRKTHENGIQIWELPVDPRKLKGIESIETRNHLLLPLENLIEELSPKLIHAHGWEAEISLIGNRLNIPTIITVHHAGVICPNFNLINDKGEMCHVATSHENCLACTLPNLQGGKLWAPLIKYIPTRLLVNTGKSLSKIRHIPFFSPSFMQSLFIQNKLININIIKSYSDIIICPSHSIGNQVIKNWVSPSKVKVRSHGIPTLPIHKLSDNLKTRPIRFIYVGRITELKGLHLILEAFNNIKSKNYELHIVGSAARKDEINYQNKLNQGFSNVATTWHGHLEREKVMEMIRYCDVMIHPAILHEVFGLSIAEALASGRPVIASRCGGPEMQIEDNINGWLIPRNDAKALKDTVTKLINSPKIIEEAANRCTGIKTISEHIDDITYIYKEVINEKNKIGI